MRWLIICSLLWAQDTIRVMTYNLLNYGGTSGYCLIDCKERNFTKVVSYARPALLSVNEVAAVETYARRFLDSVLNREGINYYRRGGWFNASNGNLVSVLYYDSRRFTLLRQTPIYVGLRDIVAYRLFYNAPDLAQTRDTIFFTVIPVHYKAGNNLSDQNQRNQMAQAIMNYLDGLAAPGYVLVLGDMNLYTSSEAAWQTMTSHPNATIRLYDPVGQVGNWSQNSSFALWHTQSTRTQSLADGGSSQGLDDRFDFILCNQALFLSSQKAQYVSGSYDVIGQDGQHFRKSVTDAPLPAGYPSEVVYALYAGSDHLPVVMDIAVRVPSALSLPATRKTSFQRCSGGWEIWVSYPASIKLYTLHGGMWHLGEVFPGQAYYLPEEKLPRGLSLVQVGEEVFKVYR
ncbi:MAG: hypothetical protein ACUVRD_00685 [Bacteroidia bacterium]